MTTTMTGIPLHAGSTAPHATEPRITKARRIERFLKATSTSIDDAARKAAAADADDWRLIATLAGTTEPSDITARMVTHGLKVEADPFDGI